jgi:hypothetical protein
MKSPVLFDNRLSVDETAHRSKERGEAETVQQEDSGCPSEADSIARQVNRGVNWPLTRRGTRRFYSFRYFSRRLSFHARLTRIIPGLWRRTDAFVFSLWSLSISTLRSARRRGRRAVALLSSYGNLNPSLYVVIRST